MYSNCKIYGPYVGKDGRKRIIAVFPDGTKKTVSYPKYIMELYLNRYLEENETVDHIDCDFTNNDISNLQILDRKKHIALDVKRLVDQEHVCPWCTKSFTLSGSQIRDAKGNRKQNKAGPFCSRSCAGKYGKSIQLGASKLPVQELPDSEYTTLKAQQSLTQETE